MCGIAGILDLKGAPVKESEVRRMTDVIAYRGPDGQGVYTDTVVGLGHRRLSIIDLSAAGHQPMTNEDGTVWLTFNGEIYNYLELLPILQRAGHRFKSRSDSEVIIHAYEEWGERCVERFNGMWAFAIWDSRQRRLFLSRDRFGVKPLYYYRSPEKFYFASEIKSILAIAPAAKQPNYPYFYPFLNSGLFDHSDETFFKEVKQLLPAHSMRLVQGRQTSTRHWDYDPDAVRARYDYSDPRTTFRTLLEDAVRLRLRSDVPVGTCLSGGLDSSSIVSLASGLMTEPVKTFSCLYDEPECDEKQFVDILNRHCKTDPYPLRPSGKDLFDVLPQIVWHQDEPTAGPGLYSQWHVMKAAKGRVKVLLDGQGGDELLGGYFTYYDTYLASLVKDSVRHPSVSGLLSLLRAARELSRLTGQSYLWRHLEQYLPGTLRGLGRRLGGLVRRVDIRTLQVAPTTLHPDFVAEAAAHTSSSEPPRRFDDDLNERLYWHLVRDSVPALLHYEDRNSMAFSIEARTPFLDYRLVEFCLGLPYGLKIHEGTTKYLLREALRDVLPREICERRDKKGYPTPMGKWFREGQRERMKDILYSRQFRDRGIFNPAGIQHKVEQHCQGTADCSWEIYRWLTMELWFRMFID